MGKILSFIFFVASAALLVITFFFPLFVYNIGPYTATFDIPLVGEHEVSMTFNFGDECTFKLDDEEIGDVTYKFEDGKVVLNGLEGTIVSSLFDVPLNVDNAFTVSIGEGDSAIKFTSIVGIILTAVYALICLISLIVFIVKLCRWYDNKFYRV